ncbi:MAG: sigma-54-dependent Fis family transcriptional regulator [Acidobacteria bacterium]|nr:MAG: sigma-54-dependent Fis family transcriptional regulator [Acidobacteriota bacterium]
MRQSAPDMCHCATSRATMAHVAHTQQVRRPTVLVVDDDPGVLTVLRRFITRWNFDVETASSGEAGLARLEHGGIDVVMVDLNMPGIDGLNVLQVIRERWPSCKTMLMTGSTQITEERFEAIKLGALDFLEKPLDTKYLEHRFAGIRADLERHQQIADLELRIAEQSSFQGLVGRSAAMRELFDLIRRMAPYARVSLITGETGVGKELVARAMHQCGRRAAKPFVAINCAAVAETIVESELFGHVRGAFTGAVDAKPGLIERADGGTLFLDEVGELSLAMQAKFLRVLESGELYRVGSVEPRRVDVTILAATNRDLEAEVRAGRFRSDLYFRLNIAELHVPALRDRPDDIPTLAARFIKECGERMHKPLTGLSPAAERILVTSAWPGNVRQLRNVIERAAMLAHGSTIEEHDVRFSGGSMPPPEPAERSITRERIEEALARSGGNRLGAARALGVSRRTFYRLLGRHDLRHLLRKG